MFKENLNRMCKKRGTTLTKMLKDLGYSSSKTTAINNGQLPKEETLLEMAKYLDCAVMDFFDDEEEEIVKSEPKRRPRPVRLMKTPIIGNNGKIVVSSNAAQALSDDEQDLLGIYRSADRRKKHEIMAMIYKFEGKKNESSDIRKVFEPRTEG